MTFEIERRALLQMLGLGVAGAGTLADSLVAFAQGSDAVTIGWPSDVPAWDPNQRFKPDAQPIYKLVFDQPLDQNPKLDLIPKLVTKWDMANDGLSLAVELRDDVKFHNGDKMTADDFRYTFFERMQLPDKIDTKNSWRKVSDIAGAVADQGGDEILLAGTDGAAMAGLPRQLCRAEKIYGAGRRRQVPAAARRQRVLTSWSTIRSTPASCWSATTIIGARNRRSSM